MRGTLRAGIYAVALLLALPAVGAARLEVSVLARIPGGYPDQDPARVLKLDPRTGAQSTWATFPKVGGTPEPDFAAWGPDGSLYVPDYSQFVIFRVPPGGGAARVWLADPRFNGIVVGPAGIELMPDGRTLMLSTGGGGAGPATGKLYTLPIEPGGGPGPLHQVWESAVLEAPDGFAIARSGNVYLSLVGPLANAVVELSPAGREIARVPANPFVNQSLPVPFDAPGSVTFDGDHVIVTKQSSIVGDNAHGVAGRRRRRAGAAPRASPGGAARGAVPAPGGARARPGRCSDALPLHGDGGRCRRRRSPRSLRRSPRARAPAAGRRSAPRCAVPAAATARLSWSEAGASRGRPCARARPMSLGASLGL